FALCAFDDLRIIRVQQDGLLSFEWALLIWSGCGFRNAVGVVEDNAQVAQTSHAGFRTNGGLANLEAWVAQRTFFGLAGLVVEVDLLIRTTGYAHAPTTTLILVHQDDAIFSALVHCT